MTVEAENFSNGVRGSTSIGRSRTKWTDGLALVKMTVVKNIFYFLMEVVANVIQGVIFKQYLHRLLPLKISAFTGSDQKNLSLICKKSADMSRHASLSQS